MSPLDFEPEVESQSKPLAVLTASPPIPRSSLAFEPETGGVLDRVLASEGLSAEADRDVASLVALAAGSGLASDRRASAHKQPAAPADPGIDLSGDLEAELFGMPARAIPDDLGDFFSSPDMKWSGALSPAEPKGKATGERRTTGFLRATRFFPAQAESALHKIADSLGARLRKADAHLARVRLNLAGIAAALAVAGLTLAVGIHPQWVAGIAGACLALVALGQSASGILGFAGLITGSAAVAEIIRQRERFQEILQSFLG